MNLHTLDLVRTEKFLQMKFPSVTCIIRYVDNTTFDDTLKIRFAYAPDLIIKLGYVQYKNGGIFYDYLYDQVTQHFHDNKPPVKFDLPPARVINESYPNCDPNYESKVWKTIKSDFGRIVDVLFPISFLVLYSVVFFSFGFILAYLLT